MPRIRQPFALGVAAEVQTTLPLKAHKKLAGHYQRCPNHQSSISWLNVERPEIPSQNFLHSPASTSHMPVYLKPKLQATKKNRCKPSLNVSSFKDFTLDLGPQVLAHRSRFQHAFDYPPGSGNSVAAHVDTKGPMAAGTLDAYHDASRINLVGCYRLSRTLPKEVRTFGCFQK